MKNKKDNKDDDKIEEEVNKIIEEMKENLGEEAQNIQIMRVTPSIRKKMVLTSVIRCAILYLVVIALIGFFKFISCPKWYEYLIFAATIVGIDFILNFLISKFLFKLLFYTLGLLKIVPIMLAFIIGIYVLPFVNLENIGLAILSTVIYGILKLLISFTIGQNKMGIRIK